MIRRLVPVFAILLTLAACTTEKPAEVKESAGDSSAAVIEPESEAPSESPSEDTARSTAKVGDLVEVGSWDVKVTRVTLNAAAAIKKANQFNDKAKGQYVLVDYEATYNGSERKSDADFDLTWTFTTTDSQVQDQASVVTPNENADVTTEARQGGTVKGQAVFDLAPDLIKGGLLSVEGYDDGFDTVYADFEIS